ncbi:MULTISPECIES: flagellar protein FliS [Pseudobutyrivibrio]|uniref:Flagellar protein FliS n=1 Tax=Pseudobutyrivibrio xylanivorans TaxID=185007 RepID=A0A1G5RZV6_PSEXY|nr:MULTISPECIES: flagellar protein FliS [Pseudobutyrivibrio]MDC7279338.1 flagellar protein FliS [Butyrivibrio fibrisolvens]SCZ78869.1 flagellar protein FliS [Pseudobutyrivibrio xylanivorans]
MNRDKISAFTLKIASSNGSGLISILYDIYNEYETEALDKFAAGQVDEAIVALKKCADVVNHLQRDLNFEYKVSSNLYALYDYVQRNVSKSIYKANSEGLLEAKRVMDELGIAFDQVAKKDSSAPIMRNTQYVRAGVTYGREALNESLMGNQTSRGFWA